MTDLKKQAQANASLWDRRAESHLRTWYDLDRFKAGQNSLDEIQLAQVGSVSGKDLLHLQCNAGLDTLSWARLGARATGVDLAEKPLSQARRIARACGIDADFVHADVLALPETLHNRFDIVYTSQGVLCWIGDIARWAAAVRSCLRPGGVFYLMEEHPLAATLDEDAKGPRFAHPYFNEGMPDHSDDTTYQSTWSLGEVVQALIGAGLGLEALDEYPYTFYQRLPYMKKDEKNWWHIPNCDLPLMYTLKAVLP